MANFITTEHLETDGYSGELKVWEALKAAYQAEAQGLGYWRYPLVSKEAIREPDILFAEPELGISIIEVKALPLSIIHNISGYRWELRRPYYGKNYISPYEQAKAQASILSKKLHNRNLPQIAIRALIALPSVTREEWDFRFGDLLCDVPILFEDQLSPSRLRKVLSETTPIKYGYPLHHGEWLALQSALGTSGNIPKNSNKPENQITTSKKDQIISISTIQENNKQPRQRPSKASLMQKIAKEIRDFDFQQEQISKTIPAGPQRIRGIAGSGKTVLLTQKAANMHLKHPDWDIALVFFCRSLYETIKTQVDHWLRVGSNDEVNLDGAKHKIRILHAWGAKNQAGFYRVLTDQLDLSPRHIYNTPHQTPSDKLAYSCKELLKHAEKTEKSIQIFDAVLIDEGQDLITEKETLYFKGTQPFYWMAYQSLRPIHKDPAIEGPKSKRLIWAYDEAQSLDALIIPSIKEIFGDYATDVFGFGPVYKGGIKKSEIMKKCYRTPRSVLMAAHALGMGIFRRQGMLTGLTNKADWEALGYEIQGVFRNGHQITLSRPIDNSPHPLENYLKHYPEESLLSFKHYSQYDDELQALIESIQHDIKVEGLAPEQILVITLDSSAKATNTIFQAFHSAGLDIYIASAKDINTIPKKWPNNDPNGFRRQGAVTLTSIARAKGNEADMVYVIGINKLADKEDDIKLRNQLFIAISRSCGWVHLSGTKMQDTTLKQEIEHVLSSQNTFQFTYQGTPKRTLESVE